MARHPHQVFSREQLMEAVWQYSFYTDTSTVTVHIRRLRTKLEADPAPPPPADGVGSRVPVLSVSLPTGADRAGAVARGLPPPVRAAVAIVVAPVLVTLVVFGLLMVISGDAALL